jgi:hypothetical protein
METVRAQLRHVRLGCLTDPTTTNVLRENSRSGIIRTARGTGTNEADNLDLDRLTGNHIGISRAERLIGSFFEKNNHRKQLCRLGEDDYGTFRTEQLALNNSLAHDIGYVDLPFPNATHPAAENVFQESIGFDIVQKMKWIRQRRHCLSSYTMHTLQMSLPLQPKDTITSQMSGTP